MKTFIFVFSFLFSVTALAEGQPVKKVSNFLSLNRGSVVAAIYDDGHAFGRKFRLNVSAFCNGNGKAAEWEDVDARSYCAVVLNSLKVDAETDQITLIAQEPDYDLYESDLAAAKGGKKTKVQLRCKPKRETVVLSMQEFCK